MRALAKDLHISVITVQRAYEDLTRDGFIINGFITTIAYDNFHFLSSHRFMVYAYLYDKYSIYDCHHLSTLYISYFLNGMLVYTGRLNFIIHILFSIGRMS